MNDVLVLDLGTSYFKASVFSRAGELRALRTCSIPSKRTYRRHEMAADAFTESIAILVRDLESALPHGLHDVEAVTFATQTNSFLLLDAENDPLSPFVIWDDPRAHEIPDEVQAAIAIPALYETTGVPGLSPAFMAAKLLWFQCRMPDIYARVARIGLISDYLTHWMTSQWVTEAGAAGLTGLIDIYKRSWWQDALERFNLQHEWMPEVVHAGTDVGPIRPDVAAALHLPQGCRFVVGCLDQYAGAIGVGNVKAGGISETTGTVLATVRCTDSFAADAASQVFFGPGYESGVYYQMVFGSVSANLLEFYRNALSDRMEFAEMDRAAAQCGDSEERARLPFDMDEAALCNLIASWARDRDTGEVTRAILERVAFALYDQVAALSGDRWPDEIVCAGGAARSDLWRTIKANVLGVPTVAVDCPEPTSLGAALLALRSITGESIPDLADACIKRGTAVQPDMAMYNRYAALRSAYRD